MHERLPVRATVVLGVVTIVGFGVWFYGYGVLLEPIREDTGWSEATLSSVYGVSLLGAGALATLVGRLLHRQGSRLVYTVGAAITLPAYLVLATSTSEATFAVVGVIAGSTTGALGYYAAVHTVIAQLVGAEHRAGAITTNTLWGAFASPIFLPLLAWMVLGVGWRSTLQAAGFTVAAMFLLAAVVVPDSRGDDGAAPSMRALFVAAARDRVVLALLTTTLAGGLVTSVLFLYQVPVMVAAGLTLGVASGLAGARGFLQLAGRIPMPWLIRRLGSRTTLRLAHLVAGVSCVLLPLAGTLTVAVVFAVVAGISIGALIPAESIFSADAIPGSSLGVVLGASALTRGVGAAVGPVVAGTLSSVTGSRTPALLLAAAVAVAAAWIVPIVREQLPTEGHG